MVPADDEERLRAQLRSPRAEDRADAVVDIGKRGMRNMCKDIEAVVDDPDPIVREAAIRVLAFYWKLPAYKERALQMSQRDPDEETRMVALMAWADYFNNTRDAEIARYLYGVMRDQTEQEMVRAMAYTCFLAVCGVPSRDRPRRVMQLDKTVDETIDWNRAERLLKECAT